MHPHHARWTPRLFLSVTALLVCLLSALAAAQSPDVAQYAHTAWRNRDGFSKGTIYSIAQTADGCIWLGTENGLLRFDGVRTVPWRASSDQSLPSDKVIAVLAARDGTLWIGSGKGLASWKGGKLRIYPDFAGLPVMALLEDGDDSTVLHVPALGLVVAGDVAYNNVHQYLADGGLNGGIDSWLRAIDMVRALQPAAVVAGHKDPSRRDDPRILDDTAMIAEKPTARGFFDEITRRYPDRLNPGTVWLNAQRLA